MSVRIPLRLTLLVCGFLGLAALPAMAQQPAADKIVAKVDGAPITEADVTQALTDLGESIAQIPEAQRRDYAITYLADLKLGAKAAREAKLTETEDFKRKLAYQTDRLLFDDYLTSQAKKNVTEDAMKALYADTIKTLKPEQEVRARHILVETEDQAKDVIKKLKAGEDFAKLAGTLSKDPGSGKEGGDLGYFTKDRMVPEFANAAFAMTAEQISDPVKSQFGYHVIKVEDKRDKTVPKFDEVKDQIEQFMYRKSQQDVIMALRATGKVERLDAPAATPAQ
ncbi:MAG: peptidylprolyl isomerase [Alphaproteobacteria bacterium]|nr:peptidylprolyl isomerase [Alphaproteobacteria bacterium]